MATRSLGLRATTLAAATLTAAAALSALPASAATAQTPPAAGHAAPAQAGTAATAPGAATTHGTGTTAGTDAAAREYKGRVIARSGLYLRDRPTRGSRVIRVAAYKSIVHIFCKTRGDNVGGNDRWYLLTDGTWAWGAARYIENIGAAPRWC